MSDAKQENGYYVWKRGDVLWLGNWFKTTEFSCQCKNVDCVDQKISVELIDRLTKIRDYVKSPMRITSGFRCSKRQDEIRKSGTSTVVAKKSTHELGHAADISVSSLTASELLKVAEYQFKSIGLARNFIHVDLRDDRVRRWDY